MAPLRRSSARRRSCRLARTVPVDGRPGRPGPITAATAFSPLSPGLRLTFPQSPAKQRLRRVAGATGVQHPCHIARRAAALPVARPHRRRSKELLARRVGRKAVTVSLGMRTGGGGRYPAGDLSVRTAARGRAGGPQDALHSASTDGVRGHSLNIPIKTRG